MSRFAVVLSVILGFALAGCGGAGGGMQHPLTNELDPAYDVLEMKTLGALPFTTDISEDEDPDGIAASMVASTFYSELNRNTGFTILPESEVARIIEQTGLTEKLNGFYKDWLNDQWDIDKDFLKEVAGELKVDGLVVGGVDVWYQDEIDITEEGTSRTQVGVMVGLFDGSTGARLWLGRDENSADGLRYPGMAEMSSGQIQRDLERNNQRTVGGAYAPPDYAVVVDLVVGALVTAFPTASQ